MGTPVMVGWPSTFIILYPNIIEALGSHLETDFDDRTIFIQQPRCKIPEQTRLERCRRPFSPLQLES